MDFEIKPTHTYLGWHEEKQKFIEVNDKDRQAGTYVVGVQGVGKSSLLLNMIYQDVVKGYSVIVLEPHGDLINSVIATMPGERVRKTYVFDLTDTEYPFGMNCFYCANPADFRERARVVGRVVGVFEKIFPELEHQQYAPHMLEAIAETFVDNPGHTMSDIPRLLTDQGFRNLLVRRVKNRGVKQYWETFNSLSAGKQQEESKPLLGKLNKFLLKPLISNILDQQTTTIDLRQAIIDRALILVYLPVEVIEYKLSAEIIGTMLLAEIYSTTFGFADLPADKRPGFSLYVDEFQNFATKDYAELFAQGRKFGIRQTVAHQRRDQLDIEANKQATLSAFTKVVYRVTDDDSRVLARQFTDLPLDIRPKHIPRDVFRYLPTYNKGNKEQNEQVRTFAERIVRPLQQNAQEKKQLQPSDITIVVPKGLEKATYDMFLTEMQELLYNAMVLPGEDMTKTAQYLRVVGMASLWRRFTHLFVKAYIEDQYDTDVDIDALALDFVRWTLADAKNLEDEKLQYTFFVYLLDHTIEALRQHPIGEEKETTDSDRAAVLANLKNGIAWVKIGSTSFEVDTFTLDKIRTHKRLAPKMLEARKQEILRQTRSKYCRKRTDVEKEIEARQEKQKHPSGKEDRSEDIDLEERPRFEDI
jgi:hypothetical protein